MSFYALARSARRIHSTEAFAECLQDLSDLLSGVDAQVAPACSSLDDDAALRSALASLLSACPMHLEHLNRKQQSLMIDVLLGAPANTVLSVSVEQLSLLQGNQYASTLDDGSRTELALDQRLMSMLLQCIRSRLCCTACDTATLHLADDNQDAAPPSLISRHSLVDDLLAQAGHSVPVQQPHAQHAHFASLAAKLLSLSDCVRSLRQRCPQLTAARLLPQVLMQLCSHVALPQAGCKGIQASIGHAELAQIFLAELISTATKRGHADAVAAWLLQAEGRQPKSNGTTLRSAQAVCAALSTVAASSVHELLWSVLVTSPSLVAFEAAGHAGASHAAAHLQQMQTLQHLWKDGTAVALPREQHAVLACTLLGRRSKRLPPAAQALLLTVLTGAHITSTALAQLAHTANAGRLHRTFSMLLPIDANQSTVSTLYSIAQTLLQQWGDARVVRSWQPRESACLTHTVMLLVLGLGAEGVEQSSAVMQALLQGVQARMSGGATKNATARQAKRVARLFSLLMAPLGTPAATQAESELGGAALHHTSSAAQRHAGSPVPPRTPSPGGSSGSDTKRAGSEHDSGADDVMPGDASLVHEPYEVLYDEADLSLLPQEVWWDAPAAAKPTHAPRSHDASNETAAAPDAGPMTDSEDSDAASTVSLEPLDLEENTRPVDVDKNWRPVQLHHVLAEVRQSEDTVKRVTALGKLEQLVRASAEPEVVKAAPELMRSLLYVAVPEWACEETPASNTLNPERRRLGSMAATLAAAPREAADALIEHVFTDNVDTSQRMLALDCFGAAAAELTGAPSLPPLTAGSMLQTVSAAQPALLAGKYDPAKTRVWGNATLRKLQDSNTKSSAARNKFGDVVLHWAAGLLDGIAKKGNGPALFRGQEMVLGRFLVTMGGFCRHAALTRAAPALCNAVLELLLDPLVAKHEEPFIRNSALVATAELLRALPAPMLAGAMLRSERDPESGAEAQQHLQTQRLADASPMELAAGVPGMQAMLSINANARSSRGSTAADAQLTTRLQHLHNGVVREHAANAKAGGDETRCALAAGCLQLQAKLAENAMAALDAETETSQAAGSLTSEHSAQQIVLPPW